MTSSVLSVALRPKNLDDFLGQNQVIQILKTQLQSGRLPHFYLITGSIGSGKTSLARILALLLQYRTNFATSLNLRDEDWKLQFDIQEINSANKNGIDDIRQFVSKMKFRPREPSLSKVMILDEAHAMTIPAQNSIITETEDVVDSAFYIFCTSTPSKIIPALQRRAFILALKDLESKDIETLLTRSSQYVGWQGDIQPLIQTLKDQSIGSAGIILQIAERYFSGMSAIEAVQLLQANQPTINTLTLCRHIIAGNWGHCASELENVKKDQVYSIKCSILGYLKSCLLKSKGNKAIGIAKAIQVLTNLSNYPNEDFAIANLVSSICLACEYIRQSSKLTQK